MFKEATINDLNNEFFDLYYEGFLYHYNNRKDVFKYRTIDEIKEYVFEEVQKGSKILLLKEDSELIGYVSYEIKNKLKKVLWIDELVIKEKYRHQGYGTKLMDELVKRNDYDRMELNCWSFNENAIKFYEKLGYKEQRIIFEKNKKKEGDNMIIREKKDRRKEKC